MNAAPRTLQEFPLGKIKNPVIDKRLPVAGLEKLRVEAQTLGNLMICFDAENEAQVIAAGENSLLPQLVERVDSTLLIKGAKLREYFRHGQHQKIFIEVHIPAHTHVHIEMFAGVVILNGGEGDVSIQGNFGEVAGVTNTRNLRIQLKAGDVNLHELHGTADIHLSVGSGTFKWTALDGSEQIEVRCGFGGIDLHLPPGITPTSDLSGLMKDKTVVTPQGSKIHTHVGFGGLDVLDLAVDIADALL